MISFVIWLNHDVSNTSPLSIECNKSHIFEMMIIYLVFGVCWCHCYCHILSVYRSGCWGSRWWLHLKKWQFPGNLAPFLPAAIRRFLISLVTNSLPRMLSRTLKKEWIINCLYQSFPPTCLPHLSPSLR